MKNDIIYTIKEKIVPNKMIYNMKQFDIYDLDLDYIVEKYFVHTLNEKIKKVELVSFHPNCDPNSNIFCIPKHINNIEINYESLTVLENIFRTFNLDNCYYAPWKKFKYVN